MIKASWLTPFRLNGQSFRGAAYTSDRVLCQASLRESPGAVFKHSDPLRLKDDHSTEIITTEGDLVYLGHLFDGYGHFLVETLPMLAEVISPANQDKRFVFLPFTTTPIPEMKPIPLPETVRIVKTIVALVAPHRTPDDLLVHCGTQLLRGRFTIIPRPVKIRHAITNPIPYLKIISALRNAIDGRNNRSMTTDRLFLSRKDDRIDPLYGQMIESLCIRQGFTVVRPEQHTFEEQVAMMANTTLIAGFQGSQLHNAIFARPGSRVIEFGDRRRPFQANINQRLLADLTGSVFEFIPYTPEDVAEAVKRFQYLL